MIDFNDLSLRKVINATNSIVIYLKKSYTVREAVKNVLADFVR